MQGSPPHAGRRAALALGALGFGAAGRGAAAADPYPNRAVTLTVGYAPGGGVDIFARLIGRALTEATGQSFVVENRPGGGQNVGAVRVARAAPDGYVLFMSSSALAVNVSLYRRLEYDPVRDFAPAALFAQSPNLLLVNPALPVRSVAELLALGRGRPDPLAYSSSGVGSSQHLSGALLMNRTGVELLHVPYTGTAPSLTSVQSGEAAFTFSNIPAAQSFLQNGQLRPIATTGAARSASLPDVPTMAEAGVPEFEVSTWYGILAPAATPREVIERLNATVNGITRQPAFLAQLASLGAEPISTSPEGFARFIAGEIERWRPVVAAGNATVE